MGFKPRRHVYLLQFEDGELEGLEVRMRPGKLGVLFDAQAFAAVDKANPTAEDLAGVIGQLEILADHLVSWNIETEKGIPIPADLEGLKDLEIPLVARIMVAWQQAMGDVAAPLPQRSSSSRPPDSLSLPMEALAASLAS